MLNFYYSYAICWGIILLLYELPWSNFNKPLDIRLLIFLVVSITTSIVLGTLRRSSFNYRQITNRYHRKLTTLFVLLLWLLDFAYDGQIPLFSIAIFHSSGYTDFKGIPTFHVIIVAISSIYVIYLFALMLGENEQYKRKCLLWEFILTYSMFLLLFYRGLMVMVAFACLCISIGSKRNKIVNRRNMAIIIAAIIIGCFVFGVLGNIRMGDPWYDSSSIQRMGKYTDKYPKFIPKQFMWAYSYITSPLANLNNYFRLTDNSFNVNKYYLAIVPDFLTKSALSQTNSVSSMNFYLIEQYFNASTGYADAYAYGGIIGLYVYYFLLVAYAEIICKILRSNVYFTIVNSLFCMLITFVFFNNTLTYSVLSIQPILIMLYGLSQNKFVVTYKGKTLFGKKRNI